MMVRELEPVTGDVLEEDVEFSMAELCGACRVSAERLMELIEYGVLEPLDEQPGHWRFRGVSVRRVRSAVRLERDLGVNLSGAALALDLLEEIERLRARLRRFEAD